jgi:hypothetical protein
MPAVARHTTTEVPAAVRHTATDRSTCSYEAYYNRQKCLQLRSILQQTEVPAAVRHTATDRRRHAATEMPAVARHTTTDRYIRSCEAYNRQKCLQLRGILRQPPNNTLNATINFYQFLS